MSALEAENLALTQHIIPPAPIWIQLWLDYLDGDMA